MGDVSDFELGQIVGASLAGISATKTATLLGVSRATVSMVMSAYTNHGKTTSAKGNTGRKLRVTERDHHICRRIVSRNDTIIEELNIHPEDPVSTKTGRSGLHKSNIHIRAATAIPLITESNVQ
jgi:predicted transcriptional regulator